MTAPGVYSPEQIAAHVERVIASDGVDDEAKAILKQFVSTASVGKKGSCVMRSKYVNVPASVYWRALKALREMEGE